MVKKFLIFLLVFGFFLRFSSVVSLATLPRIVPLPSGVFNTTTPTPTPTPALLIKPRVVTTIVLPPKITVSPTATPTSQPTQVLTSPTPQPTPTPQISPLATPSVSSTNIWQLTTIGLAAAVGGGLIVALALKKGGKKKV